jgi:hypothetical protein
LGRDPEFGEQILGVSPNFERGSHVAGFAHEGGQSPDKLGFCFEFKGAEASGERGPEPDSGDAAFNPEGLGAVFWGQSRNFRGSMEDCSQTFLRVFYEKKPI